MSGEVVPMPRRPDATRAKLLDQPLDESSIGERIAASLQEQHRDLDLEQVSCAFVGGATGGMKWEAEEHQTAHAG